MSTHVPYVVGLYQAQRYVMMQDGRQSHAICIVATDGWTAVPGLMLLCPCRIISHPAYVAFFWVALEQRTQQAMHIKRHQKKNTVEPFTNCHHQPIHPTHQHTNLPGQHVLHGRFDKPSGRRTSAANIINTLTLRTPHIASPLGKNHPIY